MTTLVEFEQWFSPERLAPYRDSSNGNGSRAIQTYAWNAELSAACWRTLGHLEVLLRQSMHTQLVKWSQAQRAGEPWYLAIEQHLIDRARTDIGWARRRVRQTGKAESTGRVVAELSFGFWRYLLSSRYERSLWLPCLREAFPNLHGLRKHVERPVSELHRFRNRLAHHEPIHRMPVGDLREKIMLVAGWIDPAARDWIEGTDSVPTLLSQRP